MNRAASRIKGNTFFNPFTRCWKATTHGAVSLRQGAPEFGVINRVIVRHREHRQIRETEVEI